MEGATEYKKRKSNLSKIFEEMECKQLWCEYGS